MANICTARDNFRYVTGCHHIMPHVIISIFYVMKVNL